MKNMLPWLTRHLSVALDTVAREFERGLADTDLSGTQLFYLFCVCQSPALTQDELAQQLGVNASNVTRQMGVLERLGYISRRRDPEDGRAWQLRPTDRAYDMLPRLVEVMDDAQEALLRGLSFEERELLLELVDRMGKNAARREAELRRENK